MDEESSEEDEDFSVDSDSYFDIGANKNTVDNSDVLSGSDEDHDAHSLFVNTWMGYNRYHFWFLKKKKKPVWKGVKDDNRGEKLLRILSSSSIQDYPPQIQWEPGTERSVSRACSKSQCSIH